LAQHNLAKKPKNTEGVFFLNIFALKIRKSMTFNKITIIDNCGLTSPEIDKISILSRAPMSIFYDFPETKTQIIERIGAKKRLSEKCLLI
jgi:hypothetical protein